MTNGEIVKALRCTSSVHQDKVDCKTCPFYCTEKVPEEWVERIQCSELPACDVDGVALAAADLIERLEKEKAALLERVKIFEGCDTCKNYNPMCCAEECGACVKKCPCASCTFGSKWEWKGPETKAPEREEEKDVYS